MKNNDSKFNQKPLIAACIIPNGMLKGGLSKIK